MDYNLLDPPTEKEANKKGKASTVRTQQQTDELQVYLQEIRSKQRDIENKMEQEKQEEAKKKKERERLLKIQADQEKLEALKAVEEETPEVKALKAKLEKERLDREEAENSMRLEYERKLKAEQDAADAEKRRLQ